MPSIHESQLKPHLQRLETETSKLITTTNTGLYNDQTLADPRARPVDLSAISYHHCYDLTPSLSIELSIMTCNLVENDSRLNQSLLFHYLST